MLTRKLFNLVISKGYIGYVIPDKLGNQLIFHKNGGVGIKIKTEKGRERTVGSIFDNGFFCKRENDHIHYKSNSLGFNFHLLIETELFDYVMLSFQGSIYQIPKQVIIENGKCLNFKDTPDGDDFELQIFFPISMLEEYLVK